MYLSLEADATTELFAFHLTGEQAASTTIRVPFLEAKKLSGLVDTVSQTDNTRRLDITWGADSVALPYRASTPKELVALFVFFRAVCCQGPLGRIPLDERISLLSLLLFCEFLSMHYPELLGRVQLNPSEVEEVFRLEYLLVKYPQESRNEQFSQTLARRVVVARGRLDRQLTELRCNEQVMRRATRAFSKALVVGMHRAQRRLLTFLRYKLQMYATEGEAASVERVCSLLDKKKKGVLFKLNSILSCSEGLELYAALQKMEPRLKQIAVVSIRSSDIFNDRVDCVLLNGSSSSIQKAYPTRPRGRDTVQVLWCHEQGEDGLWLSREAEPKIRFCVFSLEEQQRKPPAWSWDVGLLKAAGLAADVLSYSTFDEYFCCTCWSYGSDL
jgi:hypothetical protein